MVEVNASKGIYLLHGHQVSVASRALSLLSRALPRARALSLFLFSLMDLLRYRHVSMSPFTSHYLLSGMCVCVCVCM